ncbi:MAG: peptidylprolyl isomerase [Alistipes sp.]
MASLNTLRTKFGILLSVIIALALLAFVLSLKTEMGFSGNDPKVGVINGEKVTYSEYINEYEKVKTQSGASEGDPQQADMLTNATWQTLISKYVLMPGFNKLGITVSEAERLSILSGEHPSQVLYNAFANTRTGTYDVAAVSQFLAQAETNPQAKQAWIQLNEQMRTEREIQKYMGLVKGGAYVNSLEIAQGVKAANNTFTGKWAGRKYTTIADSLMVISTGEIKSYYKSHKEMFKQSPSRTISYAVFEVTPSADDLLALETKVKEVGNEFAATTELKSFIRNNRNGKIADTYVTAAQLSTEEAAALMSDQTYGPTLKNNMWTMSRVVDSKVVPDSLGIKHIVLPATEEKLADSLITVLNAGADFAQIATQYSVYDATATNGGEVGVLPFSAFTGEFAAALSGAKQNDIVKIAAGDAIQIMQVYRAGNAVKQVQLATITYPVEASAATKRDIHNAAGTFTVNAKGSFEAFNEAASTASITPRVASITQGERVLRGVEDSREVVRWAYGAKENAISEIFNVGNDYVIAILTGIDDDTYASVEKATPQIKAALLRDKKFEAISKEISGTSFAEQAKSLNSDVTDFTDLNYSAFYIDGLGVEPRLIGAISATTEKGVASAPIKGSSGVYIFTVDNIVTTDQQTAEAEKVRAQAMAENVLQQLALPAIQQMADVQDLSARYF